MENFTNETIDTKALPRFEQVQLSPIDTKYWKVILINIASFFLLGIVIMVTLFILVDEVFEQKSLVFSVYTVVFIIALFLLRVGFKKKAYAFRNHDVIFRRGIIATNTMVIPYNRVQHVALHEGFIDRFFGLAKIEIFTAGGESSDLKIPGIAKEEAENIKQLLMGKIQKQL